MCKTSDSADRACGKRLNWLMTSLTSTECINLFLQEAQRLGIEVKWDREKINNLDASYHAQPGKPGLIMLHDRTPQDNSQHICRLITHEMVHVLQHWKGDLRALPPLGWPIDAAPSGRNLSIQEQEAYSAQKDPLKVLKAIQLLQPLKIQVLP